MEKFIILFIIISLVNTLHSQKLEITNLNDQPLLTILTGKCRVQTGTINIIHPINVTDLEFTVDLLTNIVYQKTNNYLSQLAKHKTKELYSNLLEIRPRDHRRRRSIETVGTAWKWIGGSPDAADLRIINNTINELITSNNQQYKVNEQLGNRLAAITKSINDIIQSKSKNKIILDEIDTIITMMKIDMINKVLEDIAEAVMLSKVSLTSSKILSQNEIFVIRSILNDQGISTDLPEEIFNLVKPSVAVNGSTLLYILKIPQVNQKEGSTVRIVPLPKNGQIITEFPDYLIKLEKALYLTTEPDKYIQQSKHIKYFTDNCIQPLMEGRTSRCTTKESLQTEIQVLADDLIVIINANNSLLQSNCGPDNRNLTGNILISFSNCSITCGNQTFSSITKETNSKVLQGAMHNLVMDQQPQEDVLKMINNFTITNREKIDHVYLMQFNSQLWDWSLLGGISVSMLLTVTISVFAFIIYRKSLYQILLRIAKRRKAKTPSPGDQPNQDA